MQLRSAVALMLLAAACGGSDGAGTTAAVSTTTAPLDTTTTAPTTQPPVTTTTTMAPATDGGAADWFDPEYLALGPGAGFVPLDDPIMVPAADVGWMGRDSLVLGVVGSNGEAHAFPVDQMAYHHIANTTIAGEPYLVTY